MRPHLHAETVVEPRALLRRGSAGRLTATTDKELLVLSPELELLRRFDLPYPTSGVHAVSTDLSRAVLSLRDRITTIDDRGRVLWEHHHTEWAEQSSGSCCIQDDGTVWATVPTDQGPDRWLVLAPDDGWLMAELVLDGAGTGSDPVPHPDPDRSETGLSVGTGHGDFRLYWGQHTHTGSVLRRLAGDDNALADVHPGGEYYLATSPEHDHLTLHDLDDGREIARVTAEDLFRGDLIDFGAVFLTEDLVLAPALFSGRHLALDAHRLEQVDTIDYPGINDHDTVLPAGPGSWVTADWLDGRIRIWEL
jgi:hypothetical protein